MKTRPGRFDSSQIDQRIVFHPGRSLSGVQFRDFETFLALRRGCARFLARPANESAKRFAGDIEPGFGEPLPDLFVGLSRADHDFNFRQKRTDEGGLRRGWFSGQFFQGVAVTLANMAKC